jgi:DNA-binding winged helix-turn-helix (wHTH) protein
MFGPFEVNPQSGELQKNGIRIRLSGQPFRILLKLLERPGQQINPPPRKISRTQRWLKASA